MNTKRIAKQKKRMSKFDKFLQGKSYIGTKRLTLLPGSLANGCSSNTVKKGEHNSRNFRRFDNIPESQISKESNSDHVIFDDLISSNKRNGTLRRSERLMKKHDEPMFLNKRYQQKENSKEQRRFNKKSTLKDSKSMFKVIGDEYSQVCTKLNTMVQSQLPDVMSNLMQQNYKINEPQPLTMTKDLCYNSSICQRFVDQICVTFKKNVLETCKKAIQTNTTDVNLILSGKMQRKEYGAEEDYNEEVNEDAGISNGLVVPPRNWVYYTPRHQNINTPIQRECQLEPAYLCQNSLYFELPPKNNNLRHRGPNYEVTVRI
ncbi:hypothetical protein ABEB36_007773 [Hypothenemus hampei]|uniref:Uncharacterized protein n=1 Tax=Hypothenemus hampei TaxID=57062 RepID=A0ABD1EVB0_HYPHA